MRMRLMFDGRCNAACMRRFSLVPARFCAPYKKQYSSTFARRTWSTAYFADTILDIDSGYATAFAPCGNPKNRVSIHACILAVDTDACTGTNI